MSADRKETKPRVNFSQTEMELLKSLVLKRPVIEKKSHDFNTETSRKVAWESIKDEFNAEGLNVKRTVPQLKGAWKRIKASYKSQKASERRSKFKTGGGPPSPSQEDPGMDELFSDQTPLENIPDDDDDYVDDVEVIPEHSKSPNVDTLDPSTAGSSTAGSSRAHTPTPTSRDTFRRGPAGVRSSGNKKTHQKVVTFAQEFHKKRMEYLKSEHELKMQVLEEERSYWELMKRNETLRSSNVVGSVGVGETSEGKTYQLLGNVLNKLE